MATCTAPQAYDSPDSGTASVSGSCWDQAGNRTDRAFTFKYDSTAPQVTSATPARGTDANGWYDHPLSVSFAGTDATSGVESCSQPTYTGPDSATASLSGSCRDRAGNVSPSNGFPFKYDATGPQVTNAIAARPSDRGGWYNHPVVFAIQGVDATAGIESCPPSMYSGPAGANAAVIGSCVDKAGNRGVSSFGLAYDATGPQVSAVPSRGPDAHGWYNHALTVNLDGSDAVSGLGSCGTPQSYDGPDSAFSTIVGWCSDKAGNVGLASFALRYDATAGTVGTSTP